MPYLNRRKDGPGSAGGKALVAQRGSAYMAELGRRGAQALLDRHGCEHMAEIGANGYRKVMQRQGLPFTDKREFWSPPPDPLQLHLLIEDPVDHAELGEVAA